jgi:hypothetical protein
MTSSAAAPSSALQPARPVAASGGPPPPEDLDVEVDYNFAEGSALLPESLELIGRLQEAMITFEANEDAGRGQGRDRITAEQLKKFAELTEYRNRVSTMRAEARHHEVAQEEFMAVLDAARRNLTLAGSDLKRATELDPSLYSVLREVYDDLVRKHDLLRDANGSLRAGHDKELKILKDAIFCGEALLDQLQKGLDRGLSVSKLLRDTLLRAGDRKDFDAGLLSLEQALEVNLDLGEVLEAAEGGQGR